jgi:hypothetical protein
VFHIAARVQAAMNVACVQYVPVTSFDIVPA